MLRKPHRQSRLDDVGWKLLRFSDLNESPDCFRWATEFYRGGQHPPLSKNPESSEDRPCPTSIHPPAERPSIDERGADRLWHGEPGGDRRSGLQLFQSAPAGEAQPVRRRGAAPFRGDTIPDVRDRSEYLHEHLQCQSAFCRRFSTRRSRADAYTLEHGALLDKIAALSEIGGTQILMQGRMNRHCRSTGYLELLSHDQRAVSPCASTASRRRNSINSSIFLQSAGVEPGRSAGDDRGAAGCGARQRAGGGGEIFRLGKKEDQA